MIKLQEIIMKYLNTLEIEKLLNQEDLTQKQDHAVSLIIEIIKTSLEEHYGIPVEIERGNKIVSLEENYYILGYDRNEVTLSERYTKYVSDTHILRTQMTSAIPMLLSKHNEDKIYMCPGIVYRRDVKDKTHVGEPHQMDIWMVTKERKTRDDLLNLVNIIINIIEKHINKKIEWRYNETVHHYTEGGIEVEIKHQGQWLEILECGLISQQLLKKYNLSGNSGLALGMGLERLVMLIKCIDDIRILKDERPEIQKQMSDLKKYKVISRQPSTKRDLSIAIDKNINEEELTELILRDIDLKTQNKIESIKILSETYYENLPDIAKKRLGINDNQKNILLRITLRDLTQSIENEVANNIYEKIYKNLHKGTCWSYL